MSAAEAADDYGVTVGSWLEFVRRARIPRETKLVALTLASYANNDGTHVHCSFSRLAFDCDDMGYATARRHVAWLRDVGLVQMTKRGNRRRRLADEYRLIIGPDVLEAIEVPDGERYKALYGAKAKAESAGSRERAKRYREKKRAEKEKRSKEPEEPSPAADNNAQDGERYSPVDNSAGEAQEPESSTLTPGRALFDGITLRTSRNNAHPQPADLQVRNATPPLLAPCTEELPPIGVPTTGGYPSLGPQTREAETTPDQRSTAGPTPPEQRSPSEAEIWQRYGHASAALAALPDVGTTLTARARADLGDDAPYAEVVLLAADLLRRPA